MPFTKTKCPSCGKVAETQNEFQIGTKLAYSLKCGHLLIKDQLTSSDSNSNGAHKIDDFISIDGKKLFNFQKEGVKFIERSGGRALVADEMGLGKTVQALATIALHREEMLPAVYILKSSLKFQWQHEIYRFVSLSEADEDAAIAQVIETSKDWMLPGMQHYIFSFDILRRFKEDISKDGEPPTKGSLREMFQKRGIKTIVIDECQQIKNPESQRARQVRGLCKGIPNILALSGTPIKNNASEYFSILNILKPEMFKSYQKFIYNECDCYHTGYGYKVGGLRDPKAFLEKTKNFIIRRQRSEVMPDLPQIDRRFHFDELGAEVQEAYKVAFMQFRDDYYSGGDNSFEENGNILAYLSRMRHLTGLSKVKPCVEFLESFLTETDRKITIFAHHIDVREILERKINKMIEDLNSSGLWTIGPALVLKVGKAQENDETITKFKEDIKSRILIASTLASGEGLNLQFSADCIILEREWNPANEEQAEGRFIRIGQASDHVESTYFVAVGTVDEFFSKIVEEKREIVGKTLNGEAIKWNQSSLIKELAEVLAAKGGAMWGY